MQCPSCGALREIGAERCPMCEGLYHADKTLSGSLDMAQPPAPASNGEQNHPSNSKLIDFPGVPRNSVPQWRKDLSERVREVHEKRAREAALEAAEGGPRDKDEAANATPLLELLPQADVAPLNPIVTAALRRIERAHYAAQGLNRVASTTGAAALAYANENEYSAEELPEFEIDGVDAFGSLEPQQFDGPPETEPYPLEKVHNLVVVPPPVTINDSQRTKPKPRRLIVENDPALNYLDSVPTSVRVEVVKYHHAPAFARLLGALVDLMVVALLCAPFAALVELTKGNWRDFTVAITGAAVFSAMSFLYFTISTALTGRTLGLRLFSLRIVDARTGLIPTGKQSAGRALVYLGTILTLGLASLYVLIDRDKQTAHDRLTRTTVITV
jgi:uncharacterized RDD family membrane protein YckC